MTNKVTIKSTKEPVRLRIKNLAQTGVQSLLSGLLCGRKAQL